MSLPAQKQLSRVCRENQLYSITYNVLPLVGCQELSPRARRYLAFFISVVKCGYHSIIANADTIADSIFRAQGQTKSVRTLQYALTELEAAGFISRRKYRVGDNHFKTVIELHTDRFIYWTKIKSKKVVSLPTQTHISSYVQGLQIDDRRNQSPCLTPKNTYLNEHNKQRAGTRSKPYANFKHIPIIFTLLTILKGKPDRGKIVAYAQREIDGYSKQTDIRWNYWSAIWQSMPVCEREGIARVDFLPRLRQALSSPVSPLMGPTVEEKTTEIMPDNSKGPLSDPLLLIRAMIEKTTPPEETKPDPPKEPPKEEKIVLTHEELAVLLPAKYAVKNRL